MRKILAIALLNVKGALRDKFFFGVVFFFAFYLLFCIFLGKISAGMIARVIQDAGLFGIELTAIILTVVSFTYGFYREKETGIIEVYLSQVGRTAYVTGKIAGFFMLALLYLALSAAAFTAVLLIYKAFTPLLLAAIYPMLLKLCILILFTSVFCSLCSSPIASLLSVTAVYFTGELIGSAVKITNAYAQELPQTAIAVISAFLPHLDKLDIKSQVVRGEPPTGEYLLLITLYAVIYSIVLWAANICLVSRKEF